MPTENNSGHGYRLAYLVCGVFLIAFFLVTWAVVNDAHRRSDLEKVIVEGHR